MEREFLCVENSSTVLFSFDGGSTLRVCVPFICNQRKAEILVVANAVTSM